MYSRKKKVLKYVGFSLVGLAVGSFAFRVVYMVLTGRGHETYRSGTLVQWTYSGAFVVLIAMLVVLLVGIGFWLYGKFRY